MIQVSSHMEGITKRPQIQYKQSVIWKVDKLEGFDLGMNLWELINHKYNAQSIRNNKVDSQFLIVELQRI